MIQPYHYQLRCIYQSKSSQGTLVYAYLVCPTCSFTWDWVTWGNVVEEAIAFPTTRVQMREQMLDCPIQIKMFNAHSSVPGVCAANITLKSAGQKAISSSDEWMVIPASRYRQRGLQQQRWMYAAHVIGDAAKVSWSSSRSV